MRFNIKYDNKRFTPEVVENYLLKALSELDMTADDLAGYEITVRKTPAHIVTASIYFDGRLSLNFPSHFMENDCKTQIIRGYTELHEDLRMLRVSKGYSKPPRTIDKEHLARFLPHQVWDMLYDWEKVVKGWRVTRSNGKINIDAHPLTKDEAHALAVHLFQEGS